MTDHVKSGMDFVFVASEFENIHERTDWYCHHFLGMFSGCGLTFGSVTVVDSRLSRKAAQEAVQSADVLWLAGGDTPTQFSYLHSYGLIPLIQDQQGVVIGMSAGSINMGKIAVCTLTCDHREQVIYEALGLVQFSVEPHFDRNNVTEEILTLSEKYPLYGICDEAAIVCVGGKSVYLGDVFFINNRQVLRVG